MPERVVPGPVQDTACIKEDVCIHTRKIYDSCRDKDCIEDLRLYVCGESQNYINAAVSVRAKSAKLLFVAIDVEEINFNKGCYTVDLRYFYKVRAETFSLVGLTHEFCGLAVFDKRVVLFGSEGNAKIFTSRMLPGGFDIQQLARTNLPIAVVEAVDPIVLGIKVLDVCECPRGECELGEIPEFIKGAFEGSLVMSGDSRRVYVTLGQFSIVKLERDSQLRIPAYGYCMPEKECAGGEEDPCGIFRKIQFPVNEFFPPDAD